MYPYVVDKTEREVEPCGIFGGRRRMNGKVHKQRESRVGTEAVAVGGDFEKVPSRWRRFPRSPDSRTNFTVREIFTSFHKLHGLDRKRQKN